MTRLRRQILPFDVWMTLDSLLLWFLYLAENTSVTEGNILSLTVDGNLATIV